MKKRKKINLLKIFDKKILDDIEDWKKKTYEIKMKEIEEKIKSNKEIKDLKIREEKYKEYINDKSRLINTFRDMKNTEKCEIFVEKAIKAYTGESIFCYLFNRMMRNIESGIILLAYYMGLCY